MNDCSRCGKCCELLAIGLTKDIPIDAMGYLTYHGVYFDKGFALIYAPCEHLSYVEGKAVCDIEKTKPQQCRDFDGRKLHHGRISYVPDGCGMQR